MTSILAWSVLSLAPWNLGAPPIQFAQVPQPPRTAAAEGSLSYAERIARLQRLLASDRESLKRLKSEMDDPQGEYGQAQAQFQALDGQLLTLGKQIDGLKTAGKVAEAARLGDEKQVLSEEWQAARDRFDLAIQERKILHGKLEALRQKVQQDQQVLDRLTGAATEPAGQDAGPAAPGAGKANPPSPASPSVGTASTSPAAAGSTPAPAALTMVVSPPSKQVVKAQEDLRAKEAAAREAGSKAQSITERLEAVRRNVDLEQRLLENTRKRTAQVQEAQALLQRERARKLAEKAGDDEVRTISLKIAEAEQRVTRAREESQAGADRLREMQGELAAIQDEQIQALHEADQKRGEAEQAERKLAELENPFSLANLLQWAIHHAPKLLLILLGMVVLNRLVKLFTRQVDKLVARHTSRCGKEEGENRAQTLIGVFRNVAALVIYGGGSLALLDEVGLPIGPLLGGAAVAGLAVAFGAQNLIRDYFSGFMVLLEDQYSIGDVVKIGDVSGTVEKITLRMTVLRDLAGSVHFVPHGTITRVSNLTHGWSRAHFEIAVAYKEDVDRVMAVLIDLAQEMQRDPEFGPQMLEDPEMLGVDDITDSAVIIKFVMKTKALKQWPVKREMLRRIKRKFDELKIEMPFPHRTIYHRLQEGDRARQLVPGLHADDEVAA